MNSSDIISKRLASQRLIQNKFSTIEEVVGWLGAMQAQDYPGALWSIALRLKNSKKENELEKAYLDGKIIRTHIMRPTWHFVLPQDIRWMLKLTSPRVQKFCNNYYKKTGLTDAVFKKSNNIMQKILKNNNYMTRSEIAKELRVAKIDTGDTVKLSFIMMNAELEGLICSGGKKGKQFTYALLEERVPQFSEISREEALAKLTLKFFESHGPAQIKDFTWWSGLTAVDAKLGIERNEGKVVSEVVGGKVYYGSIEAWKRGSIQKGSVAFLLPPYDEYTVAFKDRSDILESGNEKVLFTGVGFWSSMVLGGKVVGMWRRALGKGKVNIEFAPVRKLSKIEQELFKVEAERYGKFLNIEPAIIYKK